MPALGSLPDLHADACKKCLLSCSSLHRYTASQCPTGTCDPCKALAELDVEISDLEARLAKCAERRRDMKTAINVHHDLLQRFPFEITSQIFNYVVEDGHSSYVKSNSDYVGKPVLVLGAVCKRWRDVTFNAPELWSWLTIDLWKLASDDYFDVIKEFVARSRTVPLFLRVYAPDPPSTPEVRGEPRTVDVQKQSQAIKRFLSILDPQCGRWKGLHLDSTPDSIRSLFNEFERYPELDILQIDNRVRSYSTAPPAFPLTVPRELTSKVLRVAGYSCLADIPLQCDRITDLDASMMGANELLYVIKNAPNLQRLRMNNITRANNLRDFPMPTARFQCNLLTRLDGETCLYTGILRLLTVPALQTLTHTFLTANVEFDGFLDCLHHSKFEHLTHLSLVFQTTEARTPYMDGKGWYDKIPALTHLRIQIPYLVQYHSGGDILDIVKGITSPLDSHRQPLAFPLLQDFQISAPMVSRESWSLLYNMLRPGGIDGQTRVRTLQRVVVWASSGYSELDSVMNEEDRLGFLREIDQYGVELDFRVQGESVNLRDENCDSFVGGIRRRRPMSEEEMSEEEMDDAIMIF